MSIKEDMVCHNIQIYTKQTMKEKGVCLIRELIFRTMCEIFNTTKESQNHKQKSTKNRNSIENSIQYGTINVTTMCELEKKIVDCFYLIQAALNKGEKKIL